MTRLEYFKLSVETLLLTVGVIFAVIFAFRTWPYPSGGLSVSDSHRYKSASGESVSIVFDASFALGSTSNLSVEHLEAQCAVVGSDTACAMDCFDAEAALKRGALSAGDSFAWSCRVVTAPAEECVSATITVSGKAPFPTWQRSSWWAQTLSCP